MAQSTVHRWMLIGFHSVVSNAGALVYGPNSGAQNAPPDLGRKNLFSADVLGLRWVPADLGGYKTRSWVRTDCTSDPGHRTKKKSADLGGYKTRSWARIKSFLIRAIGSGSADLILRRFFFQAIFPLIWVPIINRTHFVLFFCWRLAAPQYRRHRPTHNICKLRTSIAIIGIYFDLKFAR